MDNLRERAKIIYIRSGCTKGASEIAKELQLSTNTVKSWKRRDHWNDDKHAVKPQKRKKGDKLPKGGQPGNKHAVYSDHAGNQNAVKTGEYARIMFGDLTEKEKALLEALPDDKREIMRGDLQILTVRENRMLQRIETIRAAADRSGLVRDSVTMTALGTTIVDRSAIEKIMRIEEALTRVRAEKQKILNALNDYELRKEALQLERERKAASLPSDMQLTVFYDYGEQEDGS